ncbi:hypothetical protein G9A89_018773 [Geosiphon pyriformis]|nr:hypothetical protein G9A89_018773 [Geosiphon pyriformis]
MTTTKAKSKKVANITFSIVTNKVSTQEGFSVIETARQNILAIFPLKNISEKLSLAAFGLFSLPLANNFSSVKVLSKRHIQVSLNVVSTTSKSPKIFNNRPANKLVFLILITSTTTTTSTTSTALQIAIKAKNFKKQQQVVTTAMVTPNFFVVPNEIFSKIFIPAATTSLKIGQDQLLAILPNVVFSSRSLPIPVSKQSIISDNFKDLTDQIEIESTAPPPISGAANVALHDVPLGISSNDIKSAFGIFGVVTFVKLKSAGLWQYAVVHFKDTSSAAAAFTHWSVLIRKDSVRILPVVNQNDVISLRDTFKTKLVNLSFGCTVFEIKTPGCCYRCQDLTHLAVDYKRSPLLSPKLSSNTSNGPRVFKLSFAGLKFYAKAAVFVVPLVTATADMNLDLGGPPKTTTPMLPVVSSAPNIAVESRLASLESHLSELFVLIKFLVKLVGALVVLVTKLLSTPSAVDVSVKEYVTELAKQNKGLAAVTSMMQKRIMYPEKKCKWVCLEDVFDDDDIVNDNNDDDKNFSVYDNIFDVMMHL